MLTEIKLTNFKCFKEETAISLSKFNLFTGVNGAGKSTALQSLLLMRQSIEHNPYTTELILNGSCVNLGSFSADVKNIENSKEKSVIFETSIYYDSYFQQSIRYYLNPKKDDMSLSISKIDLFLKYNEE
jgi:predicted ATPase